MELDTTINIVDIVIIGCGIVALYIQWRALKQQKLEFRTKLESVEELVHKIEKERTTREAEIEARIEREAGLMNYTSEMWQRSYEARTGSHQVLRNDVVALALIVVFLIKEIRKTAEPEETDNMAAFLQASLGIVGRAEAFKEWVSELDGISTQHQEALGKVSKRKLSSEQLHNRHIELNEKHEADIKLAIERHQQRLDEVEKLFGKTLEQLAGVLKRSLQNIE